MEGEEAEPLWQRLGRGGIAAPPASLASPSCGTSLCRSSGTGHKGRRARSVPTPGKGRRPQRQEVMVLLPSTHGARRFAESPKKRSGGERDFPSSCRQRGRGEGLSPSRASSLRCCPLADTAALSAGKSKQRAECTAYTHTHACACMHTQPGTCTASRTTASRICAAALASPEPLKPLENPSPVSGNRSYLPLMHPNTGTPKKSMPQAPGFPPTQAYPSEAALQKGPTAPPATGHLWNGPGTGC